MADTEAPRPPDDDPRSAAIRVYPDGPLLVRGCFSITDEHGRTIKPERKTVALCRCGRTGIAPLCDGSHARRLPAAKPSR
ncbi:MAG: CDGSH iron-sulfur domain-containing protein [Actinomycetota bacterium]